MPDHVSTDDVHRAYLALLLAVLDGDCEGRAHELLCRDDDPHFALEVAHHACHKMVASFDLADHAEMRGDLMDELLELAGGDAP